MASPITPVPTYKTDFIATCIRANALKFGTFTLKSGRISPYFLNAGLFHSGELVASIQTAYAQTLIESGWEFDVLFGPAYKGIPLAAFTLSELVHRDRTRYSGLSYSFNRKEKKAHGESGMIVGSSLAGKRVVIVDDVITAGTAIREAIDIIRREGGTLVGILVAFDRLEKTPAGEGEEEDAPRKSAIGQVRAEFGVDVKAILTLDDVVESLKSVGSGDDLRRLEEYRAKYKASD